MSIFEEYGGFKHFKGGATPFWMSVFPNRIIWAGPSDQQYSHIWWQRKPRSTCTIWAGPSLSSCKIFVYCTMYLRRTSPCKLYPIFSYILYSKAPELRNTFGMSTKSSQVDTVEDAQYAQSFCLCWGWGQPNGVMSSRVSLPDHMFTGQA